MRRPSFKQRPKATREDMGRFIAEVHELMGQYPRDRIVNVDETNWKAVPGAFMTWRHTSIGTVQVHLPLEVDICVSES
jgi:hypothetical protein